MIDEFIANHYLHKNLVIKSDKQHSAQGSVYYCKKLDDSDPNKELILKQYKMQDIKSYIKEMTVMKIIQAEKDKLPLDHPTFLGFPYALSFMEGP
jgi:hypothetical protein